MLPLSQRLAFAVFALVMLALGTRGFARLYRRVARGRADADRRTDQPLQRAWYALRTTLLQERVFRRRVVLSIFHSFIFYAFVLYLLVNAIDLVDGYVDLRPLASPSLRALYGVLTDLFSVLAIVGVLAFVVRRWFTGARRDFAFNARTLVQPAVLRGYIARDSAIVSAFIVLHIGSRVVGNAARLATEGIGAGDARWQPFGSFIAPLFAGPHAMAWRIAGYWGALGSVLLFLPYFPYSKHVHILLAPLKYFFRRDVGSGVLPAETIDLEAAEPNLGAAKLADLSWPRLLDAYACIQCNRCQDVCPASRTGKALSPAALEINKRMVLNGIAGETSAFSLTGSPAFEAGTSAGPALLQAVVSPEAVWACTTCGACMEVCPTGDEQMLDLIDIRRHLVMAEGDFPKELGAAFRGMERASNPWGLARDKRMAWAEGLHVPTVDDVPDPEVLYWVGCAASYDAGAQKTARAVVQLLAEAHVSFAVLGKRECCTGDSARRAGNELLYQQMAGEAITVLQEARPKTVLASCPHCVNTIAREYPQFGGNFHVVHHTEFLAQLVDENRLQPLASQSAITFHDPCYLGRHRGTYDQPRNLLRVLSNEMLEMPRSRSNAFCCGAGGAQFWKEEEPGTERVADNRFTEAQRTLASSDAAERVLAVGCPFCKSMLGSTSAAGSEGAVVVKDVAELLWEGVQRAKAGVAIDLAPPLMASSVETHATVEVLEAAAQLPDLSSAFTPGDLADLSKDSFDQVAPFEESADAVPPSAPRRKWAPRAAAKDVNADTPALEATAAPPAPAPEPSQQGENPEPTRKKWSPRKASFTSPPSAQDEVLAASAGSPAEVRSTSAAALSGALSTPEQDTQNEEPVPSSTRKKWAPKPKPQSTAAFEPPTPASVNHPDQQGQQDQPVETSLTSAGEAVQAVAPDSINNPGTLSTDNPGSAARRKWQPRKTH